MIAYDKTGVVFALTQGSDLLLHDGESEGPLWQKTLDGPIVGVGITADRVAAVTSAGTVSWFSARTGDAQQTTSFSGAVEHAAVDVAADRIAAVTERGVMRLDGGEAKSIGDDRGTCIALAPDGTTLVGTASELVAIGLDGTRRTASAGAVSAVAHHPLGFWLAGVANKIVRWDGTGEPSNVTTLPGRCDHVACSAKAIAVSWDNKSAAVLKWPSKDTLGSLMYPERAIEGLAFGPWPWLGVSLDLGDGNKFNLETIRLHRSDTHPGREHHSWLVAVGGPPDDKPKSAPPRPAPARPSSAGFPVGALVLLAAIAIAIFMFVR
jgi:hypothetical protein